MNPQVGKLESLLAKIRRNAAAPRTRAAAPVAAPPVPQSAAQAAHQPTRPALVAAPPVAVAPPVVTAPPVVVAPPPAVEPPVVVAPPPAVEPPPVLADEIVEETAPALEIPTADAHDDRAVSGVVSVPQLTETEELLDDDIVEVAVEAQVPAKGGLDDIDIDFDDEEQPPASSSRSRVATSMDEAFTAAAEQMEIQEGREVPLKTPPPESGPQAAAAPLPAGIQAPHAPEVADLLESEAPMQGGVSAAAPTAEQLGQTIDLEEARGPSLELDERKPEVAAGAAPAEELEMKLPEREFGGGYHEELMPPPEARQELDAHRQRVGEEAIAPPPESLAQAPSLSSFGVSRAVTTDSPTASVSTVTVDAPSAPVMPELIARPEISAVPAAKYLQGPSKRPETFLELLDSSLALIKND